LDAKSPCTKCIVSSMCNKLCAPTIHYIVETDGYDNASESVLLRCVSRFDPNSSAELHGYSFRFNTMKVVKVFYFSIVNKRIVMFRLEREE